MFDYFASSVAFAERSFAEACAALRETASAKWTSGLSRIGARTCIRKKRALIWKTLGAHSTNTS